MENLEKVISPRVAKLLDLPDDFEQWQDFDLVFADADRVHHFLNVYETGQLGDQEKRVVMELIIASYDDWLEKNAVDPEFETKLRAAIERDASLHQWMLDYWSRVHSGPGTSFNVTPMILRIRTDTELNLPENRSDTEEKLGE